MFINFHQLLITKPYIYDKTAALAYRGLREKAPTHVETFSFFD